MVLLEIESYCCTISLTRGAVITDDEENCDLHTRTGLMIPRPPKRQGRAKRSRLRSFGGSLENRAGISDDLIVASRGARKQCSS